MKSFHILFILILLSSCMPKYHLLSKKGKEKYKLNSKTENINKGENNYVFSINSKEALSIIEDNKGFKMFVFFSYWCPNSIEYFPKIINIAKKKNVEILLITADDWTHKTKYIDFLSRYDINQELYMIDIFEFNKGHIHKRMRNFINSFCSNCEKIFGFPSIILYDPHNNILFADAVYDATYEQFERAIESKNS